MKRIKKIIVCLVLSTLTFCGFTQESPKIIELKGNYWHRIKKIPWRIGVSGTVIDDDGKPFNDLFNVKSSWNLLPFPTKISLDGRYNRIWSIEGVLVYNRYKASKMINNRIIESSYNLFSFDINAKCHLKTFLKNSKIIDPFFSLGFGCTSRSIDAKKYSVTNNIGVGANFWFFHDLGFTLQSMGKFGMTGLGSANYLLHSLGLVYKLTKVSEKRFVLKSKF